jgi:hypothetical protein
MITSVNQWYVQYIYEPYALHPDETFEASSDPLEVPFRVGIVGFRHFSFDSKSNMMRYFINGLLLSPEMALEHFPQEREQVPSDEKWLIRLRSGKYVVYQKGVTELLVMTDKGLKFFSDLVPA